MAEKATSPSAAPQPTEAELRELLMRSETVRQQLTQLETQREYVLELLTDARRSLATLEHVEKANDGDEILIPLGAGAFVAGSLRHSGKAITNLGSGIHAEVPVADARERLGARVASLEEAASAIGKDVARLTDEMVRLNSIAESVYGG